MQTCIRVSLGIAFVLVCGLAPACDCGNSAGGMPDAGECVVATDCEDLNGAPPCGLWECNLGQCEVLCPGCQDDDLDGYGVDTNPGDCAGPDCDDADDLALDNFVRACYSAPLSTDGIGACRAGTETCVAGVVGQCTGEIGPTGEACNAEDDDCDASTDEGLGSFTCGVGACATTVMACDTSGVGTCLPGTPAIGDDCTNLGVDDDCDGAQDEDCNICVHVAPTGVDATAIADGNLTPFLTIQAAIDWAAADITRPRNVCVAAGLNCGVTGTYTGTITMASGISVLGNYRSSDFTRCAAPATVTVINPTVAEGVVFPAAVQATTVLDGFRIDRAVLATTTAVTVDGAQGALISNLLVNNAVAATNVYAVNLINGATAQIVRSELVAASGTGESIGVRSIGSTPLIRDVCHQFDVATGRCTGACGAGGGIRSRNTQGTGVSFGVLLDSSPGAVIDRSGICGGAGDAGAGVRVTGDATGLLIRASAIQNFDSLNDGTGVWMEDCGGAAPWIVDNATIRANGRAATTVVDAIRAIGDCHPVIDANVLISGGGEGMSSATTGVRCAGNGTTTSRCIVTGNRILGSSNGFPPQAIGVRCDDDGCERIAGNVIDGRGAVISYGVWLGASGTVVQDNDITGGCSTQRAVGVHAEDSFARLENNRISGGACVGVATVALTSIALEVNASAGGNELDAHSNVLDGLGTPGGNSCTSVGLLLDGTAAAGIYRDNIMLAGVCAARYGVSEAVDAADPRIFEHNNLDPSGTPTAIYLDSPGNGLATAAEVELLTDMTVAGTLSMDPLFVSYPTDLHVMAGSPCDGAGTPTGAPPIDMDGEARDATSPDIGVDEF